MSAAAAATPGADDPIVGVDLFAGAGGASTGFESGLIDEYRDRIAAETGLEPSEVTSNNVRVQVWLDYYVELHAINHWEPAIETHEQNHPWATHHHARIEELYPPDVVEPGEVDFLIAGPECTHFSNARGGEPVSDQRRASAWHVLDWIEKLRPDTVLIENVKEFRKWGPIVDGEPSRDGTIFERWIGMLEAFGYSVVYDEDDEDYGVVLNAADYGDPQSRNRLFILASKDTLPTPPEPTHSNEDPDKPDRRPAADIIDWTDLGTSLWTRDLEFGKYSPLSQSTMARIAEGIRRHCDPRLAPFADAIETLGKKKDREDKDKDVTLLDELRETVVPVEYAATVADVLDRPFLVRAPAEGIDAGSNHGLSMPAGCVLGQHSNSVARDASDRAAPTVATAGKLHLYAPRSFCLRQQSGGVPVPPSDPFSTVAAGGAIGLTTVESKVLVQPKNGQYGGQYSNLAYPPHSQPHHTVTTDTRQGHVLTPSLVRYSHGGRALGLDDPTPTVATEKGGTFALSQPYLTPLYNAFDGQRPRTRSIRRPVNTVTANKGAPACLATPVVAPFIDDCQGGPKPVDTPLNTQPGSERFALCIPEYWPWGLDVHYRMLEPDELKQAQGFPEDYEITGSAKKTITKQIGNAVPVHLASELVKHLLVDETPSLTTFGGGLQADDDVDVPDYQEVAQGDD